MVDRAVSRDRDERPKSSEAEAESRTLLAREEREIKLALACGCLHGRPALMKHANALINKVRSGGGPCVVYSVRGAIFAVFICGASAGLFAPTAQGGAWLVLGGGGGIAETHRKHAFSTPVRTERQI